MAAERRVRDRRPRGHAAATLVLRGAHYLLLTPYSLLLTSYYLLFTTCYLLLTTDY